MVFNIDFRLGVSNEQPRPAEMGTYPPGILSAVGEREFGLFDSQNRIMQFSET